jgi:hypothetical protein
VTVIVYGPVGVRAVEEATESVTDVVAVTELGLKVQVALGGQPDEARLTVAVNDEPYWMLSE